MHCLAVHSESDEIVGAPLCVLCQDAEGIVVFNSAVTELWRRLTVYAFRYLAYLLGVTEAELKKTTRLSYTKCVEFQRRGVLHIHAVVRADAVEDEIAPPPAEVTAEMLAIAIERAAKAVFVKREIGGRTHVLGFGSQLRIDPIDSSHAGKIGAYLGKYVTKATDADGALDHRIREGEVEHLQIPAHLKRLVATAWRLGAEKEHARMRRWAHSLCFAGHVMTRSRRYSTTMGTLRKARREWQLAQITNAGPDNAGTAGAGTESGAAVTGTTKWSFIGIGHRFEIDHLLAVSFAEERQHQRHLAWLAAETIGWREAS